MPIQNTRETMTDQEILDGLVAHTLEELNDDTIRTLASNAMYKNTGIQRLNLPNLEKLEGSNALTECYNLKTLVAPNITALGGTVTSNQLGWCYNLQTTEFPNVSTVAPYAFGNTPVSIIRLPKVFATTLPSNIATGGGAAGLDFSTKFQIPGSGLSSCYNLTHLILRSTSLCTMIHSNALSNTPISAGVGWIYVPDSLVEDYKVATNWSNYESRIVPLSEYPKALSGGTITDSWSTIFDEQDAGNASTKYSVGDTKLLDVDGIPVMMQIIGIDIDGQNTITWMCQGLPYKMPFNEQRPSDLGWSKSWLRSHLNSVVLGKIEATVRNRIKPLHRISLEYVLGVSQNVSTVDSLWIPSYYEVAGSGAELEGPIYTFLSSTVANRRKYPGGLGTGSSSASWYLRTVYTKAAYRSVQSNGYVSGSTSWYPATDCYISFCFAT